MDKLFRETKIKMVMKLRNVSRAEAVRIINSGATPESSPQNPKEEKSIVTSCRLEEPDVLDHGERLMTAAEFFGEV